MNKLFAPFLPPWAETGLQPAFYDLESGTVLQQTARMYDKVNQLIRLFNELSEETQSAVEETQSVVEEYINKFLELKDFVDNYFDNLDVQEEINNKLDEMAESGVLDYIIASSYGFYFKNTALIGKFYQKLNGRSSVVINCQGDSLTYGQDTTSEDKRPASDDSVDDGSIHSHTRASITYPEELQADFNEVFGNNFATINNLGFSGDTAKLSYNRWTINRHADLALIMLGTNDSRSSASWVEADYRNNISEYFEYLGKIVERYLQWNTAVILMTPPTFREQNDNDANGNNTTRIYADALKLFADKYSCPVVNTADDITANFNASFFSDSIHFNGTGYKAIADRLFAIFCGTGIINDNFKISSNYLFNSSNYNCYALNTSCGFFTAPESTNQTSNNKVIAVNNGGKLCFGFNADYDNIMVLPICTNTTTSSIVLDFDSEQPLSSIKRSNGNFEYANEINPISIDTARTPAEIRETIIRGITNNNYILIPSRGYHTLEIKNQNATGLYFNGFLVLSLEEARNYVKKLIFDLHGLTLTNNQYVIPLNLINFFFTSNIADERVEGGKWSISPIVDLIISSGGGLVCYKMPLCVNNQELPYSDGLQSIINSALAKDRKYIDITYDDTTHGSKSSLASITVDGENLIITFDTFNSFNTSIQIA